MIDARRQERRTLAKGLIADRSRSGIPSPGRRTATGLRSSTPARGDSRNVASRPGGRRRGAAGRASWPTATPTGVSWSPDGTFLLFDTGQRTEHDRDCAHRSAAATPRFREDQFRDLFNEENPARPRRRRRSPRKHRRRPPHQRRPRRRPRFAASRSDAAPAPKPESPLKKPVSIVFDGIRERLSLLPVGRRYRRRRRSAPTAKTLRADRRRRRPAEPLHLSLDDSAKEPPVARQLTSTPGRRSASAPFTPDSKEIYYLDGGRPSDADAREARAAAVAVAGGDGRRLRAREDGRLRPGLEPTCATASSIAKLQRRGLDRRRAHASSRTSPARARPTRCAASPT